MKEPTRYRIQIDVNEDLYRRAYKAFPWGIRNSVMQMLLDQLIGAVEKEGQVVLYAVLSRKLKLFGG
jgi:hypothetical protein